MAIRKARLLLTCLALGAAATVAVLLVGPRRSARVVVGSSLAQARSSDLTMDQPFRAVLLLDRPLSSERHFDLVLTRLGERGASQTIQSIPVRAAAARDEVYVAFPSAGRLVRTPGHFRAAFVLEGEEVGSTEFSVTPSPRP